MEEDIKILEEFIEHIKFVEERTLYELEAKERCKKRYKAIENLLKTYKQFKELKENSIPKQVIRDKIEELKKQFKDYDERWNRDKKHPFYKYLIRIEAEIDILKELLESEE